jgi:Tfp pilus assembly protein PilX
MTKKIKQYIRNMGIANDSGSFVGAVLIITLVLTAIGISLAGIVTTQYSRTQKSTYVASALYVAEAGIEQTLQQLNQNDSFTGFDSEQTFFNNGQQGRAVYRTVVEDMADGNAKTITSTARIYNANNSTRPLSTRIVKVTVVGTGSEGYSVQTGPGGLILSGSANITNSDVYVNGTLKLTGAAKIGTVNQPLKVDVANQACPASGGPGFPQVCATQAIAMDWSTKIFGTVCATNQTSYGPDPARNILPGVSGQGLVLGCTAPPITQPPFDKSAHVNSMTTTSAVNNTYVCQSWPFDRTWPAKLRLNGNVSIDGSCNLVVRGDVYITGDLNIGGAATITVDNSVGAIRPKIVVDGKITVGGSGQVKANNVGTGIHFISMKSNASCAASCTALAGNELKNTQNLETISVGGAVNLPGMIFQAYWGRVTISGSGNIGSAVGQTVDMSGAGTVTFGTKLSSGAKTWTISSYQQRYE